MLMSKARSREKRQKDKAREKAKKAARKSRILRGDEVETLDSYAYTGVEIQRTLATKPTEPSIQELLEVNKVRNRPQSKTPAPDERLGEIADHLASRCRVMKYQIYEIGALLTEAKSLLPHGEFRNWVANNCDFGRTTATNCMRVFKCCLDCPEMVNYFKPTTLYAITSSSFPEDLREFLFEGVDHSSENLAPDEVMCLASAWKNGEVTEEQIDRFKIDRSRQDISVRAKKELESVQEFIKGKIAILEDGPRLQHLDESLEAYNDKVFARAGKCLEKCLDIIGRRMNQMPSHKA